MTVGAAPGGGDSRLPPIGSADEARAHALQVLEWREVLEALAERCASAAGARLARDLVPGRALAVRSPLTEGDPAGAEGVRESLAAIEEARRLAGTGVLAVGGVRDVADTVSRAASGQVLEPEDLAAVAYSAGALHDLRRRLLAEERAAPRLAALAALITPAEELEHAILAAVDERGGLRPDASPKLLQLARRREQLGSRLEERMLALRREPAVAEALADDFATIREGRPVLPVRTDRRAAVPGILHGRSGSGHSLFIEPAEVVEIGNDLRDTEFQHAEEVQRILRDLSTRVGSHAEDLPLGLRAHARLDLAAAAARLAVSLAAVEPEVGAGGDLHLPGLAHPLLLLMQSGGGVVRNDVTLRGEGAGLVLSGPNTGGKTVLLKAAGLACLMAACGLPVACRGLARVPLFDSVFADIGDEQSLARSLSSFSGHVAHLRVVLAGCEAHGPGALVLVDEIMSGTDPAEGAALAQAILERLSALGARVIVTTHHERLKAFAAESPLHANAGMELDLANLRPTWRVRLGVPGASAALAISRRLGLPDALLERAQQLAGAENVAVERLLADLEAARSEAEAARAEARRSHAEAEQAKERLERETERLRRRDAGAMTAARVAFDAQLADLRRDAARLTAALQSQPRLQVAADTIRQLDELRARTAAISREALGQPSAPAAGGPPPELERGARVRSLTLEQDGTVLDPPDGRGRVRVAFGAVSMQVDAADLCSAGSPSQARTQRRALPQQAELPPAAPALSPGLTDVPFTPQSERNSCDMRGLRVEEALGELTRFLERAGREGERRGILIHGRGTGALRAAVREALPHEPRVEGFRPGGDGEGGDGVTVVSLR